MKKQINLFSITLIKYDSKAIWAKTVQSYKKSRQLNSIIDMAHYFSNKSFISLFGLVLRRQRLLSKEPIIS
jgi:hypothetical protein